MRSDNETGLELYIRTPLCRRQLSCSGIAVPQYDAVQKYKLKPLEQYSSVSLALDGPLAYISGALITYCHSESVCGLVGAWFSGLLVDPILIFQNTVSDRTEDTRD